MTGTGWIALSDRIDPPRAGGTDLPDAGRLVIEIATPLSGAQILLDHRANRAGLAAGLALSLTCDPETGLAVTLRQGPRGLRLTLPCVRLAGAGTARITLGWQSGGRRWSLRHEALSGAAPDDTVHDQPACDAILPTSGDIVALCAGRTLLRHPAVLWYGVAGDAALPGHDAPWLGLRTPIATPRGYVPAAHLRAGDVVLTQDGGARALIAARRMPRPSRGTQAPVLLRAPYYAQATDLLVSGDQPVALRGAEVEYLFGEDEVLVAARHLVDGWSALLDHRRAATDGMTLDTGGPDVVLAGGCPLALLPARNPGTPSLRLLRDYEAAPLLTLMGRGARVRAA